MRHTFSSQYDYVIPSSYLIVKAIFSKSPNALSPILFLILPLKAGCCKQQLTMHKNWQIRMYKKQQLRMPIFSI